MERHLVSGTRSERTPGHVLGQMLGSMLGPVLVVTVLPLLAACGGNPTPQDRDAGILPPAEPETRGGMIYTPRGTDANGCTLYSVHVPGGIAPAAMFYQDEDGRFVLGRPEKCVRRATAE